MSWTDVDSLTLEQICKDLGISETELNPFMLHIPAQFLADVNQTETTQSRRLPKEDADQINKDGRQTDPWTDKRAKVAKWAVSEADAARADGKTTKRVSKSDDVFDGGRRDVDERTRRDLDDSDDELY